MIAIHLYDPTKTTKAKALCRWIRDAETTMVEDEVTCGHCIKLILERKGG